jgi:excinuclease UvrABC ATPase subunit
MNKELIIVQNAHTNNLKNINIEIPKHKLVAFTGVSGSGKSSLLFDTIYTEAQRQLIETFSTFARTRMPKLSRPDVDDILNLSTAMVIDQKRMGNNGRHSHRDQYLSEVIFFPHWKAVCWSFLLLFIQSP